MSCDMSFAQQSSALACVRTRRRSKQAGRFQRQHDTGDALSSVCRVVSRYVYVLCCKSDISGVVRHVTVDSYVLWGVLCVLGHAWILTEKPRYCVIDSRSKVIPSRKGE